LTTPRYYRVTYTLAIDPEKLCEYGDIAKAEILDIAYHFEDEIEDAFDAIVENIIVEEDV